MSHWPYVGKWDGVLASPVRMRLPYLIVSGCLLFALASSIAEASEIQAKRSTTRKSVKKAKKKPVSKKPAPKVIDKLNAPVVGVWYLLDSDGVFVKSTKMTLSKYGEFDFVGSAWRSKGTFRFRDGIITLSWTSVDNRTIPPGSMKKALPVTENCKQFQIDRFRYGKFS